MSQEFTKIPVVQQIEVYKKSLILIRPNPGGQPPAGMGARGKITKMTKRSMSRLVHWIVNTEVKFESLMTLTYGKNYPVCGRLVKQHLNRFLVQSKRLFGQYDYAWFLEFQTRGAPHFHILTSLSAPKPRSFRMDEFADLWSRIVEPDDIVHSDLRTKRVMSNRLSVFAAHNHEKAWEMIRKQDGAARYAVQYCTKGKQKIVPVEYKDVGWFWGVSNKVRTSVKVKHRIDVVDDPEARKFIARKGREDVSKWEFLPKIIFYSDDE